VLCHMGVNLGYQWDVLQWNIASTHICAMQKLHGIHQTTSKFVSLVFHPKMQLIWPYISLVPTYHIHPQSYQILEFERNKMDIIFKFLTHHILHLFLFIHINPLNPISIIILFTKFPLQQFFVLFLQNQFQDLHGSFPFYH